MIAITSADKIEIQELTARYALAMDEHDIESWMQTWAQTGSPAWEGGLGTYEGLDRLRQLLPALKERLKNRRHMMSNFVIEGTTSGARQTCYMLIVDTTKQTQPGSAVYTDKLEKIDGIWLFTHRSVKLDV